MGFSKIGGHVPIPSTGVKPETKGEADGGPREGDLTGRRLRLFQDGSQDAVQTTPLSGLNPSTPLARSDTSSSTQSPAPSTPDDADEPAASLAQDADDYHRYAADTPLPAVHEPPAPSPTREALEQRHTQLQEKLADIQKDPTLSPRRQAARLGATQRQLRDTEDALARTEGRDPPARSPNGQWAGMLERLSSAQGMQLFKQLQVTQPPVQRQQNPASAPPSSVSFISEGHPLSMALQAYHRSMDDIPCDRLQQQGHLAMQQLDQALAGIEQLEQDEDVVLLYDERLLLRQLQSQLQSERLALQRAITVGEPDSPGWPLRELLDLIRKGMTDRQLLLAMELAATAAIYETSYQLGRPVV